MSQPIIFLEFDSVLMTQPGGSRRSAELAIARDAILELPALWRHLFREDARGNLRALHLEFAPTYVITSSWTAFLGLDDARAVLRLGRLGFIADHLEPMWYTHQGEASFRVAELERWVYLHSDRPYVVLDDHKGARSLLGTQFGENTVVCAPNRGFDLLALARARSVLLRQKSGIVLRKALA